MFSVSFGANNQQFTNPQEGPPYQLATHLPLPPDIVRTKRVFATLEEGQAPSNTLEDYKRRKFSHESKEEPVQATYYPTKRSEDVFDSLESFSDEDDVEISWRLSKVPAMPPPTPV